MTHTKGSINGADSRDALLAELTRARSPLTPEELPASDPQQLWTLVEPFVETKEGERIIRNGKTPDLEEVREWVQWAQASRQLSAA